MDEIIGFAILLIIASMLERFFKAQKAKTQQQRPQEAEREATGEEADDVGRQPASLQELIAEQLGLNLERLPKVEEEPEPPPARPVAGPPARPGTSQPVARPGPTGPPVRRPEAPPAPELERVVYYPTPRGPEPVWEVSERAASVPEQRSAAPPRRRPLREEKATVERRHPDSLERPRRPEDHDRFHERYGLTEPVSSHAEFHDRYMKPKRRAAPRRASGPLPDHAEWSPAQKAIIWSEILGRPKGLE